MANAKDKISAGVAKLEAESSGTKIPKLANLAGRRVGLPDLKLHRNETMTILANLRGLREKTVEAMTSREQAIREKYANEGWASGDRDGLRTDILGSTKRRKLVDRALIAAQREVVARVESEVSENLRKLSESKAYIASARTAWASPVSVLMRSTLSSPTRATYAANLSNSGPVELHDAAMAAVRNGDHALAAAVLARVDRLPASSRKSLAFSKSDVAEALVSDDVAQAVENLALSELAILLGDQEGKEAVGKKLDAGDTLARGSAQARVAAEIGRDLSMADFDPVDVPAEPTKPAESNETNETTFAANFDAWRAMDAWSDSWWAAGLAGGWLEAGAES